MMKMRKIFNYPGLIAIVLLPLFLFSSCEKFFSPEQELNITEENLFDDWYEYRAIEMGLYGLQQKLVEQLVVLGELRGDLLEVTEYADADLVEVYNFNISKTNKYASPENFFKLISACNNFIRILEEEHPEVLDPEIPAKNYDRLYGEALCMRAWAYFTAVRIYGKVPFIHQSLATIEEIEDYINTPGTYIDSVYINFARDGYYNDTIYNQPVTLEKQLYDLDMVIDFFTNQLENEIKAVGVIHYIDNSDYTWEVTIWTEYSLHCLLGLMYLTAGDWVMAESHFHEIMYNSPDSRYQLNMDFAADAWRTIFFDIDIREHIYTIWFDKSYFQQNDLQRLFEGWEPHDYMLKPTRIAITNWESTWRGQVINNNTTNPNLSRMVNVGLPGDYYRGYAASYLYARGWTGNYVEFEEWQQMLDLKSKGDFRSANTIMEGVDTVVFKFSGNRTRFDQDFYYILYRAGGIHLYMAELYTWWKFEQIVGVTTNISEAVGIINDGSNYDIDSRRTQLGVRGRVGLGSGYDGVQISNIIYYHDPITNQITSYRNLMDNIAAKQLLLEEKIIKERALELAFEGERFYDLMRVAKRRNEPDWLARKVSAKFPPGKRDQIRTLLQDEANWYINYFE